MSEHWFLYIMIAAVAFLLSWVCDKLQILKSKPLRIFVVLLISSVICWVIYDLLQLNKVSNSRQANFKI